MCLVELPGFERAFRRNPATGRKVLGSDDDISATTKMIEIGLIRVADQARESY